MTDATLTGFISQQHSLGEPRLHNVWRTADHRILGAVQLDGTYTGPEIVFRRPEEARKLAAVLLDCAGQMEALAAEETFERTQPATDLAAEPNGDNDQ